MMCGKCKLPKVCGCNTSCCCCFKIPINVGYVVCSVWLLLNGVVFPVLSFMFWPKEYIFYGCCAVCGINFIFFCISMANMRFKLHILFNTVLYGVFVLYLSGGLMITIAINVDASGNSALLVSSLHNLFGLSIHPGSALRMLQTIQIMFYTYLFGSYVYCGFVLQLYEVKHDKRYRKYRPVSSETADSRKSRHEPGERDLTPRANLHQNLHEIQKSTPQSGVMMPAEQEDTLPLPILNLPYP